MLMNRIACVTESGELWRQSKVARELGSPFVAAVLEAGHRQLRHAPLTADLINGWADPSAAALAMRFNAALHAIARRGDRPDLTALYGGEHQHFDEAIAAALRAEDRFICEWMRHTPQTNETGRAAAIATALMTARRQLGLPFELLELGSSCGLNLNLARYAYNLGGTMAGDLGSPILVEPEWRGEPPVAAPIKVISARGVDLNPLNACDEATRERLLCFVWADQPRRARRLEQALAMARVHKPAVERGNAVTWLSDRLADPQEDGVCRVVFHSMVLQYLSMPERQHVLDTITDAGARATRERPLTWISFEWTPLRDEVQLLLTCWPTYETHLIARCHAYGNWIEPIGRTLTPQSLAARLEHSQLKADYVAVA
ncbi:DUF2332 domain-containing protein [Novosphingobium sp. M1R2S20]|uniref:DUF2332 domain-containing protein n=1 Tax=Novosphingobium rhizovicinum TaxID=3228928 RepID=A0ABV3R8X1_9SPHN